MFVRLFERPKLVTSPNATPSQGRCITLLPHEAPPSRVELCLLHALHTHQHPSMRLTLDVTQPTLSLYHAEEPDALDTLGGTNGARAAKPSTPATPRGPMLQAAQLQQLLDDDQCHALLLMNPTDLPEKLLKQIVSLPLNHRVRRLVLWDTLDGLLIRHRHEHINRCLRLLAGWAHQGLVPSDVMADTLLRRLDRLKLSDPNLDWIRTLPLYYTPEAPAGFRPVPHDQAPIRIADLTNPYDHPQSHAALEKLFTTLAPARESHHPPFHLFRLPTRPGDSVNQLCKTLYTLHIDVALVWPDAPQGYQPELLACKASGVSVITHPRAGDAAHQVHHQHMPGMVVNDLEALSHWLQIPDTLRGFRAIHSPQSLHVYQLNTGLYEALFS